MRSSILVLVALVSSARVGAQSPAPRLSVAAGTYELTLCHPACDARGTRVGRGVLVIAADTLVLPFELILQQQLRDASRWLLGPRGGAPNACFRLSAQREVAGREYYPGIIPAGLVVVRHESAGGEFVLYRSPDASFVVEVQRTSPEGFLGVGRQHDWDGGNWRAGEVEGQRIGAADPQRCRPDGPP